MDLNWRGIPAEAIRVAVRAENARRCDPPKSEAEVEAVVSSILRLYADQHGRDLRQQVADPGMPLFKDVDLSQLGDHTPPAQDWYWEGYIPAGHVTLLGGHGGAGKSTFALMLAATLCAQAEFLGHRTMPARVCYFSGEDPEALVLHRLTKICRLMLLDLGKVREKLRLIDATEFDPTLFTETRAGIRAGVTTRTYGALAKYVDEHDIDVLVIDNVSDTFAADEINRAMVRSFIRSLALLVRQRNGAVLLLSHVDKATSKAQRFQANSESYSGSTAWHNSVRSRLFLMEREPGVLELQHQKSNLGRRQEPLVLVWPEGGLLQLASDDMAGGAEHELGGLETVALLRLIQEYSERGEFVSTSANSAMNAARLFAREPTFPRSRKPAEIFALLREAERAGLIGRETYQGADRKPRERWSLTPEGRSSINFAAGAAGAAGTKDAAPTAAARSTAALRRVRRVRTEGYGEAARARNLDSEEEPDFQTPANVAAPAADTATTPHAEPSRIPPVAVSSRAQPRRVIWSAELLESDR